ncbi:MAG: Bax inhibitor-1/YccA family protein [Lachnospiraceae bacterium]|nr:Bax inhibitor-1/YccA family protein [Prevotella sp.]MCM1075632.1 Bax inhibitor-1/YccA family protein [Ruminococcus sp.]MCM1223577.1 Bax inhibitor-1/YccA family protein [Lachnospiraceae bacterium]
MQYYNNQTPPPPPFASGAYTVAEQVNAVMKKVYVRMFIGLLVTSFVALAVASSPAALYFIYSNPIVYWGMLIAMVVMCFAIPARLNSMSTTTCLVLFLLYSALMGASLSAIFIVYDIGSITYTFFITAGMFGVMSVYGYFTKSSLSKMGSFLFMALIGLMIAMVVNWFAHSSTLDWIISFAGVLIFTGLTAYDTQQIKQIAGANLAPQLTDKLATMGALNLYLDFINLFLFLLRFLGSSRD